MNNILTAAVECRKAEERQTVLLAREASVVIPVQHLVGRVTERMFHSESEHGMDSNNTRYLNIMKWVVGTFLCLSPHVTKYFSFRFVQIYVTVKNCSSFQILLP